jgi:CRISPR-associated protein Cas2
MIIIVTRDVAPRFRGFLASCMLEIGPGIYTSPIMSRAVRERTWLILKEWFESIGGGSILMTWKDSECPSHQGILTLGIPPVTIVPYDGIYLTRKE